MTTYRKIRQTGDQVRPPHVLWKFVNHDEFSLRKGMPPWISGMPLSGLLHAREDRSTSPIWKRTVDLGFILVSLPVLLPLFALIGAWVKISSPGPVFFRQTRIGLRGKEFTIYKFRSMEVRADTSSHEAHVEHLVKGDLPMVKLDSIGDVRMVWGGRMLRVFGLDELPQIINVMRGEMSLVGPRPCLPSELNHYGDSQYERFEALPGLTGYWQVHGKNETTFSQMVEMDIHYARNKSMAMDLSIIARTPFVILAQAYGAAQRYLRSRAGNLS